MPCSNCILEVVN